MLEQPLWRIAGHTHLPGNEKRLAAEIPVAREDFLDMAAVREKLLETRPVLVGENVTVADFFAAYTLDMASVVSLLEALPNLRAYMERMYARPKAPQRIAQAFAEPPRLRSPRQVAKASLAERPGGRLESPSEPYPRHGACPSFVERWSMRVLWVCAIAMLVGCSSVDTSHGAAPDAGSGNQGPVSRTITVSSTGPGGVNGAGLSGCRASCSFTATDGSSIALTAAPDPGAVFSGWSGACSGTGSCAFTASSDAQVTATFAVVPPPPAGKHNLYVSKNGSGTVRSNPAGVDCGATCAAAFDDGTLISLTATPDANFRFAGWGGACSGSGGCSVALRADATAYATFEPVQPSRHTLTVSREGNGRVTSTPSGIDCGGTCSAQFDNGQVTLSAAPDAGWSFAGWSGACSGTGACSVSLSSDVSVGASFTATPPPPDECAGLAPQAPGTPLQVQVATQPGPTCHPGHADGQGNLALVYNAAGSVFPHFFDASGKPLGNFIRHAEAMYLAEQAEGFVSPDRTSIDWVNASGQIAGQTRLEDMLNGNVIEDPTGGVVVDRVGSTSPSGPSLEAYDAHAALRWKVQRSDSAVSVALGVDRVGNTLVITRVGTTDTFRGTWFDHDGKQQPGSVAIPNYGTDPKFPNGLLIQLVPRVGSGFFLQSLTSSRGSPDSLAASWKGQIDTLGTAVADPPGWLAKYDHRKLHMARGGAAYAFIDQQAGNSPDCAQRIEVVATTGKSCGRASFNAGVTGACATLSIDVAWDGTVIQQLPTSAEVFTVDAGQVTCTYQTWRGLMR